MSVQMLSLSLLRPHPHNRRIDPEHVADLAESMQAHGQWDAIRVRPVAQGMYEIVAGHHRVEAAITLGWAEIRAEAVSLTDVEAEAEILDSNLRRKAMSELEEAEALKRLIDVYGWSQRQIAERFNRTQPWVVYRLRLVDLVPEVKEQVINRFITPTHAAHIAQAPAELQGAIAEKVQKADLSSRETEQLTRLVTAPETPPDVRKAVLQEPKLTPRHAEAIARAPSAFIREGLIKDAANGRMTEEEVEREVNVLTREAQAPRTLAGERARRHLEVGSTLVKVKDLLEQIEGNDIAGLDAQALATVEGRLMELKTRIDRLSRWVTAAQGNRQQPKGSARVHEFRSR